MGGGSSKQTEVRVATDQVEDQNHSRRNKKNPETKAIAEIKHRNSTQDRSKSVAQPTADVVDDSGWGSYRGQPQPKKSPKPALVKQQPQVVAQVPQRVEERKQVDESDYLDESDDPELYDAIMASLLLPENGKVTADSKELEEDRRLLKEVMQLSKLEDAKRGGKLSLDHLKRKNKDSKSTAVFSNPVHETLQPISKPMMPAMFQNHQKQALKPITFNSASPTRESAKATTLAMDPSYGFLPQSVLDNDDLQQMLEIEKQQPNKPSKAYGNYDTSLTTIDQHPHKSTHEQSQPTLMFYDDEQPSTGKPKSKILQGSVLDDLDDDFD